VKNALEFLEEGFSGGGLWMQVGGRVVEMEAARWRDEVEEPELSVLTRARGSVLDLGCGPGRMAGWLDAHGFDATGVDVSEVAVAMTRARGVRAVAADVLDTSFTGSWRTVLLVDGNIGIGGDPVRLLARVRDLLEDGGRVLVEVASPSEDSRTDTVELITTSGVSDPFPWGVLSVRDVEKVAARVKLALVEEWSVGAKDPRYFVSLER
jgi:SAM-dependent methyltransferase